MVEFRILGPFEVVERDQPLALGGPKQRALLAVLLLHRGEVVSTDRLIDELWGERPPQTAVKTLQVYISNLRKALGDGLLVTKRRGYLLNAAPDQVDLDRFEALVIEGRHALERGDARDASDRLRAALELWRGSPLCDFEYEPFGRSEIARLKEEHLAALEDRIEADLALGRHAALVGELEALLSEYPFQERLHEQLMLALYRSGRQADALEHYRQARRVVVEQHGIEPGPALKQLHAAILSQDPSLGGARRPAPRPASRRITQLLALAGVLLVAAAAGATAELLGGGGTAVVARGSSDAVALIASASSQLRSFPVGVNPSTVVVSAGAVWVLNADDHTVTRIDLASHAERIYGTSGIPLDLAAGDGSLWVVIGARTHGAVLTASGAPFVVPTSVLRVNPVTALPSKTILLSQAPPAGPPPFYEIAFGPQGLWVINADASVSRIDPGSDRVVETIRNLHPLAIASGAEGTWAIEGGSQNTWVARLSSASHQVKQRVQVPALSLSGSIALGAGAVWLTDPKEGELWRIDPTLGSVARTIPLGLGVSDVAYGARAVWVANTQTGTVSRIDPKTNRVTETIPVGNTPGRITLGGGGVWVVVSRTRGVPIAASVPTEATVATLLQQRRCLRAPVLWTAIKSHCLYRTGPLAP